MTRIVCAEDCGNAPKKLLLKKLLTALAKGESAFVLNNLSEDVIWERVGQDRYDGREAVAAALQELKRRQVDLMMIDNIVTHGPTGAANGTMRFSDGSTCAFAHIYRFKGAADAHIKELKEYLIRT